MGISKQIADLEEKLILIKEAESVAGKIVEAQTFWKYEGVTAPGDNEKTPITAGTSQLIVNDLKDITTTFERLDRDRNTVKLQEEILCTKEYLNYLKSILVIFTNTDSIRTAIYETEASIMIYDSVIMRRIQEAETNTDTSRKEKSHSIAGDLNKSSSVTSFPSDLEDEEARKRKVEEPHEKSEIPEISSRLMRIKLETTEKQAELKAETLHKEGVNQEVKNPRTLELNKVCRCWTPKIIGGQEIPHFFNIILTNGVYFWVPATTLLIKKWNSCYNAFQMT